MLKTMSIGVDNWQRPELIRDYYPEGLPAEWRSDFYLNEYRTALIAQSDWHAWRAEDIDELLVARRDESVLYLKVEDESVISAAQLTSVVTALGDWLAGFVVFDKNWRPERKQFHDRPVSWVAEHQAWSGWHWSFGGQVISGAPCGWVGRLDPDPKLRAQMLRSFAASFADKNTAVPFFVGGESIKMDDLQQLKTLAELLGY